MFHLRPIRQIRFRPSLDFFGLHELGLDFPLDLHRQTGEKRAVVVHALQQLPDKFSHGALWPIGAYLHCLVVVQVRFHVGEDDGRVDGVPAVEQSDAANKGTVDVVQHELHLLLGAAEGEQPYQQTKCCRRRLGRTRRPRLKVLDLVVNLIDQSVPILYFSVALLVEVGRHRNVVEEHGIEVEGVIWTDERKDAGRAVSGPALLDGKMEGLLGLALPLLHVFLLPPKGRPRHG
mmetsp:Transcript_2355/g.5324  ORF Transcript_2355/g.5324 Transcript_2355/m.5324 type:complete len:233 (-) Transcript_2355:115-813(-)